MLPKRILLGAVATCFATAVALDISLGAKYDFPLWHYLFGDLWAAAHNGTIALFSVCAATFGYLAANVKE